MPHPLVTQLRFTRIAWIRGLKAVTAEEAARRFGPINTIAWMIGHLAWKEQLYWLERAQGITRVREVKQFGYGKPLTVPALDEAWAWWRAVTNPDPSSANAAMLSIVTEGGAQAARPRTS